MPVDPNHVQLIFLAAMDASLSVRASLLTQECGTDCALRQRVEALLQAHDDTGSLPGIASADTVSLDGGAPTTSSRAAPVQVPGYEMLGELGIGGMGVVYKARQIKPDRLVALKMIRAGSHAHAGELARFQTEWEAIAGLQHPNIVQVYEVGEHEGNPYFSLEFCSAGSLAQKLNGTPLPAREAAELVETLARAMQVAHEQRVIHRDLKPANVLLSGAGTPKITDFGLAKKLDQAGQTLSGMHLGTPSYMAPEQAGDHSVVGPSADVYALGAILYECLTGRPPFKAATALDTIMQVVANEPVPPTQLQPKTPGDLETICLKCLQKEPARRYGSAEALADDLRRFQAGEPIQARPVGSVERLQKWARRRPAIAALLLVAVLGLAGILWKYSDAERESAKAARARDFLVSLFRFSEADIEADNTTVRRILETAENRIPGEFADQPELKAQLLEGIRQVRRAEAGTTPRAMILEVRGPVQLQPVRNENKKALPQTLLYSGDRLSLAEGAQIQLVFLSDLHQERLNSAREATVRRNGCEPADVVNERTRDILMTFVRLPKGTFYMGWEGANTRGKLTHIEDDVEIAVHTVTQGQWQAVMGNNPSHFSRLGNGSNAVLDFSDEELKLFPVEQVSWGDAQDFIVKLNEKERGRGFWYRLPTEAEWEYACRAAASSEERCSFSYYFAKPTNVLASEQANFNEAPKGKFLGRPTRVGAYPPNELGFCDMHGNVWQWCADLFDSGGSDRVLRGGCWYSFRSDCKAAYRCRGAPSFRYNDRGFRLARVPVAPRASEIDRLRNP